jgi:hypothetical protein
MSIGSRALLLKLYLIYAIGSSIVCWRDLRAIATLDDETPTLCILICLWFAGIPAIFYAFLRRTNNFCAQAVDKND